MKKQHRILIIDDDPGTIHILSMILNNAGYDVTADGSGELQFLQTGVYPDLILIDNQLGDKSGASICFDLKHQAATRNIPVIMESGTDDLDHLALVACADDYLSKPFCIQLLLNKVELLLNNKAIAC